MARPLDVVRLREQMDRTNWPQETRVGLIDGPVLLTHSNLAGHNIREVPGNHSGTCANAKSVACQHGTLVAATLAARRVSLAPAIFLVQLQTLDGASAAERLVAGAITLLWSEFADASVAAIKLAVTEAAARRRAATALLLLPKLQCQKTSLMGKKQAQHHNENPERQPRRGRLPGFLIEQDIGLGDSIQGDL